MAVYLIQNMRGHVKIGTASDVASRLSALQSANSELLKVIRVLDGEYRTERWLHRYFAEGRLLGEWFTFHSSMLTIKPPPESQILDWVVTDWMASTGTSQAALGARVKEITGRGTQALVSQWLRGATRITREQAEAIEKVTGGAVTKEEALFGQPVQPVESSAA